MIKRLLTATAILLLTALTAGATRPVLRVTDLNLPLLTRQCAIIEEDVSSYTYYYFDEQGRISKMVEVTNLGGDDEYKIRRIYEYPDDMPYIAEVLYISSISDDKAAAYVLYDIDQDTGRITRALRYLPSDDEDDDDTPLVQLYKYDHNGRIVEMSWAYLGLQVSKEYYTYDRYGNLVKERCESYKDSKLKSWSEVKYILVYDDKETGSWTDGTKIITMDSGKSATYTISRSTSIDPDPATLFDQ